MVVDLSNLDLVVDNIYGGSRKGNASDDPLPSLLGVDNGAGFRHLGKRPAVETLKLLVLKTNLNNPDWPDHLDQETGLFTYYGDNQTPGRGLHETPRQGNSILKNLFDGRHNRQLTQHFPPIFVFCSAGTYRDQRFLGLAVPGAESLGPDEDLVAIWRSGGDSNQRFQNYKAIFTILDIASIPRTWIRDIQNGRAATSPHAPSVWLDWLRLRKFTPLHSPRSIEVRSKILQAPKTQEEKAIVSLIYDRYKENPFQFERCAAEIAKLMLPQIVTCDLTRPWRDGGRDATGSYHIGQAASAVEVEFALEAKCYAPDSGVGVKELSRLISRLRHRQFGILVTTSFLATQAYQELKEDNHPVVVISGGDAAKLLRERIGGLPNISAWLDSFSPNVH